MKLQEINNQLKFDINSLQNRQAKSKRTKEGILKLNLEHWTSLKDSVKQETFKWKNSLMRNNWYNICPYWKLDKLGLPRQQDNIEQPNLGSKQNFF